MASLIETYYAHAQLADAAYAALTDGMSEALYRNALQNRGFATAEATAFAAHTGKRCQEPLFREAA